MDFHPPFDHLPPAVFHNYRAEVDKLHAQLLRLRAGEAIVESEEKFPGSTSIATAKNRMRIINVGGNKAAFDVTCEAEPCYLVFNSAAITGWKAFADEHPLPITRANFAFLSVRVPPGKHVVWFEHRRFGAIAGAWLSLLTFLFGMTGALLHRRKETLTTEPRVSPSLEEPCFA